MKILGLRTVAYKVNDLNKAKSWYTQAFGIKPYFDEPFYVGFNIGGFELGLQPEEVKSIKSESPITYWGVDNLNEVYNEFIKLGAVIHEEPQNVGGELVVASLTDPWGNIIGIIYNPYFNLKEVQ